MRWNGGPLVRFAAVGLALLVAASSYVAVGLHLYGRYQLAYSNYQVDPAGKCGVLITWSPPSDVFTAFYVNQPEFLVARYRSPHPQQLRLTLSIPHFTQEQSFDVKGSPAFRPQSFQPPLSDPTVLDTLVGPHARDAQIVLRVRTENGTICDTSWPVRLESRQIMQWQDAAGNDQSHYLAGWVTPQADVISTLVGRVAQWLGQNPRSYPAASALTGSGYDGGQASPRAVIDQVNAIFDTLQFVYHVHYVDENVPYQQNGTQLIQLPKDMLGSAAPTGMCVETTLLMASAVERMGMRPFVIIVPHHAFLGVALSPAPDAQLAYWETSDLNGGIKGDQATIHGKTEYNMFHQSSQILRVIDIERARQQGIEPIE
jgi:hypothetical protein